MNEPTAGAAKRLLCGVLTFICLGCDQGPVETNDNLPADDGVNPASADIAARADTQQAPDAAPQLSVEMLSLYQQLNMRSFPSSFGPRLKYYCESYLFEYFPQQSVRVDSPTLMTLVNGDDTWVVERLSATKIRVDNTISGLGSYQSSSDLDVRRIDSANDIRSDAAWIEQKPDCKLLNPDQSTAMGLTDHRYDSGNDGWVCGEFFGNRAVTPEMDHWRSLTGHASPSWGDREMLEIQLRDYQAMTQKCSPNEQTRSVAKFAVFDKPNGVASGEFVRIATVYGGLVDVVGFVRYSDGQEHRVYFDTLAKERTMLVLTDKAGDWLDISLTPEQGAWLPASTFENETFKTQILSYTERLLSADEINLLTPSTRTVYDQASSDSAVVYRLSDIRTAMTASEISGDWMKVKFVAPPEYPLINCGDDEEDFEWLSGWIKWRDDGEWLIEEEHHYGC